mgnify:FL=1
MKNLPDEFKNQIKDKPKSDIESGLSHVDNKISEMDSLMNNKLGQLDKLMGILSEKKELSNIIEGSSELLKDKVKEGITEVASEVISDTIDKVVN